MKEYELFIPLYYNDGSPVERRKLRAIQERLLNQFGGLTFHPQPHKGFWQMAGATYQDEIIILRVLTSKVRMARRFFLALKQELEVDLEQEVILIVERDVETLD